MVRAYSVERVLAGLPSPACILFVPSAEHSRRLYLLVLSTSPFPQERQNSSVIRSCLPVMAFPRHFCRDTFLLAII